MPFIGNQPAEAYSSFQKQDFTTSATTSYTLDHPVANGNEIALFINFVRQEPTAAYTASGTSLTLTSATTSSDDMYCVYLGKAVQTVNPPNGSVGTAQLADSAVSTAKIADSSVTSAKLSGVTQGITEADQYRLTANISSNTDPISSNLERVDDASFGKIGTGISVSSGIFSFPSTGLYLILTQMEGYSQSDDNIILEIHATTNNSTYDTIGRVVINGVRTDNIQTGACHNFVNVTNTTNVKVKFVASSISNGQINGSTNENNTAFTFIRMGDSV